MRWVTAQKVTQVHLDECTRRLSRLSPSSRKSNHMRRIVYNSLPATVTLQFIQQPTSHLRLPALSAHPTVASPEHHCVRNAHVRYARVPGSTFTTPSDSASHNLIIISKRDPENSPKYSEYLYLCGNHCRATTSLQPPHHAS